MVPPLSRQATVKKRTPEQSRQHAADRRTRLRKEGRCYHCGRKPVPGHGRCARCLKYHRTYARNRDPATIRKYNQELGRKLKNEVYAAYGGYRCACCGITDPEFLAVDHIDGGGNEHRKTVGGTGTGVYLYRWLKKNGFPPGFRILCHNCNWAYGHFGYCPHKKDHHGHQDRKNLFSLRT